MISLLSYMMLINPTINMTNILCRDDISQFQSADKLTRLLLNQITKYFLECKTRVL